MVDDATVTHDGLPASGCGDILLVACGALAREIIALKDANNWQHMDLQCLPAILHNHPERIVPAIRNVVQRFKTDYQRIFVVYADCGTGGQLKSACDELGIDMIAGPHCYAFFEGVNAFAAKDEMTAFYLTDFLVRQFDVFVWEPLGLDKHPELRDMYFGHYDRLVYQAQTDDAGLTEKAKGCAERLGLSFERRFTGYGDLETSLKNLAKAGG